MPGRLSSRLDTVTRDRVLKVVWLMTGRQSLSLLQWSPPRRIEVAPFAGLRLVNRRRSLGLTGPPDQRELTNFPLFNVLHLA
jgi:hypothetical protein